jgi:hypothetical protein
MKEEYIVAILFFVVVVLILVFFRKKAPLKYKRVKNLFTPSEKKFYFVLQEVLPKGTLLFAKVRAADVILPVSAEDRSRWRAAFNKVACKHFDYVVCDEKLNILFAIELDDASHNKKERKERDDFLNWACKSAGVPLLRVPLQKEYDKRSLQKAIEHACKRG